MNEKVYLEKFTVEDFDKYYKLVSDEKVMAMITERAIPLDEARGNYNLLLSNNELQKSFGSFKVMELKTNNFIGLAKLKIEEMNAKEAELGYMLLPEYWGKGIGNEVARLLVKKAKEEKQLNRITAIIDPNNIPSRKILINNGFVSDKVCEIDGLPGEILSMKI
ncbi:GNAT family N-acetyltransferase [Clostridium sp. OS1-26]|uniref:GNAT family N-acetyltransferase n=1 Tax=Clostridium sp. OS1-26 TaxID=3070681 RepID=UPI0027DF34C7|nr:GNAT family N-acetyltransferase [Clostridium sp. OS1-26]WML32804.1 GNAT family N-acetyltransferase [Clostridium sp. OS1-26]